MTTNTSPSSKNNSPTHRKSFANTIITWQKNNGRHNLPWQQVERNPYKIWVSEVMLQQTQASTVVPYYCRFIQSFPDIRSLASAKEDHVMSFWSGLGYYARARNLIKAARLIAKKYGGKFPVSPADIASLPGVGPSTAAAIGVFAFGRHEAILDGNVKRVLSRCFGIKAPIDDSKTLQKLWGLSRSLTPEKGIEAYTQGLMDLGALVCHRRNPCCKECPVKTTCLAFKGNYVADVPTKRKKLAKPSKKVAMAVIMFNQREILMVKRPTPGIWGGLWCLPEHQDSCQLKNVCEKKFGISLYQENKMPIINHTFTHFKLAIQPILYRAFSNPPLGVGHAWKKVSDLNNIGTPTPVTRLIETARSIVD